ncbi:hypothetical protein KP509_04G070900 [Ceratopteris richardii]|uniref:GrpE protein homolog n=1 Tax=Ceratopteris richardii TaxID=49495 RepID=A0A8T2V109_CERRI|nr:hypothetical protein KP509_04G070900 [Ceratopteris richardii]
MFIMMGFTTPASLMHASPHSWMLLKSVQDPDIVLKRFQSTLSEGSATVSTNGKDRNTETSKQNGAESIQQNIREGTESTAKAEDIVKTKAELKTLRDLLKDTQALLEAKEHMVLQAKQEVLTYLAEVENVRGRTKRDTESVKHHAVETFATELLDVVDNLSRIAETIPESFLTDSLANDTSGNAKLLKSLHDGITMTHKQLMKIFGRFEVQKYDPIGEKYDDQKHLAITEVEDDTRDPHTVVNVVKSGYFFKDKLIRVAEVDIVKKRAEEAK